MSHTYSCKCIDSLSAGHYRRTFNKCVAGLHRTDFSPPEAFIPSTVSVPNKFDKTFLQKQQDLINGLGVTVNTSNAKVQTHLKLVKDRVDAVLAGLTGLKAAFDTQEAVVRGDLAEVKALLLLFQVGVVIASHQHSSGPTDAQGVTTALANDSSIKASIAKWGGQVVELGHCASSKSSSGKPCCHHCYG